MTKLKAVFGRAGQFIAAHKKAAVALLLAAAIAAGVLVWRQRSAPRPTKRKPPIPPISSRWAA